MPPPPMPTNAAPFPFPASPGLVPGSLRLSGTAPHACFLLFAACDPLNPDP